MTDHVGRPGGQELTEAFMPPVHPAADIYPLMSDAEIADLADDIRASGQRCPILMTNGKILDGRNRWRACVLAGVEPRSEEWDGQGDPLEVTRSLNEKRRHLTGTQRAAIASAVTAYYEGQARERMAEGGRKGKPGTKGGDESSPPWPEPRRDESRRSVAQAAKAEGAGITATKTLRTIRDKAPEVWELARDGKVSTEQAKRLAKLPEPERTQTAEKIRAGAKARDVLPKPKMQPAVLNNLSLPFDAPAARKTVLADLARHRAEWPQDRWPDLLQIYREGIWVMESNLGLSIHENSDA